MDIFFRPRFGVLSLCLLIIVPKMMGQTTATTRPTLNGTRTTFSDGTTATTRPSLNGTRTTFSDGTTATTRPSLSGTRTTFSDGTTATTRPSLNGTRTTFSDGTTATTRPSLNGTRTTVDSSLSFTPTVSVRYPTGFIPVRAGDSGIASVNIATIPATGGSVIAPINLGEIGNSAYSEAFERAYRVAQDRAMVAELRAEEQREKLLGDLEKERAYRKDKKLVDPNELEVDRKLRSVLYDTVTRKDGGQQKCQEPAAIIQPLPIPLSNQPLNPVSMPNLADTVLMEQYK